MRRINFIITSIVLMLLAHFNANGQGQPFITSWVTEGPQTITIPLNGEFSYDFNYVWKDGSGDIETSGTHTSADGDFVTELPGCCNWILEITGEFPHFQGYPKNNLTDVNQWGDIVWHSMFQTFLDWNGVAFSAEDNPNLSQVTDMSQMFFRAGSFDDNINDWDVSNVTNMAVMFRDARDFNQSLNSWDVSQVTNMAIMFENATSFNGDLSDWDVGNVTNMSRMFRFAKAFNGDLSEWDVSNVTNMLAMFRLAIAFEGDLSDWDVSNVVNMHELFQDARKFNADLGDWNVSKATGTGSMFSGALEFNQDISNWDVSNVTNMNNMFRDAESFNQDLGNWEISSTPNLDLIFDGSGMSTFNFDKTLIAWSQLPNLPLNGIFVTEGVISCVSTSAIQVFEDAGWEFLVDESCDEVLSFSSFTINNQVGETIINEEESTIKLLMPFDTDFSTSFVPNLTLEEGSTSSPANGQPQNFTNPVTYEITYDVPGGDGPVSREWVVTVEPQPIITDILGFSIPEQLSESKIDIEAHNIDLIVPPGTDVTALVPTITLSEGATIDPLSGVGRDFTNEVTYTVTAVDGVTDQVWTVNVSKQRPFITTWSTLTDSETISIPLNGSFSYDFEFTWKDATENIITEGTHTSVDGAFDTELPLIGVYTLEITGDFPHLQDGYPIAQLTDVNQWGDIIWQSFNSSFEDWTGVDFSATDVPDLSNVTSTFQMFFDARTFNSDLSDWDVSHIEDMGDMFRGATDFTSDLSGWDISNATRISQMFAGAESFTSDLSDWQINENVISMAGMFRGASSFTSDLNNWDVSHIKNVFEMFRLASSFNSNLNNWDVSSVTEMRGMFSGAETFNGNISTWNVENVTSMREMFKNATLFNSNISSWNVGKVKNMREMFSNAINFNSAIGGWDVSQVTDMNQTFRNADNFNQDLNDWDVRNVSTMNALFADTQNFNGDISNWDMSNISNLNSIFLGATGFNNDVSQWQTSSATTMINTFRDATAFNQDLSGWDISNVTSMASMFNNSGLSPQNYDQILIGWAEQEGIQEGVELGATGITYCKGEAARQSLLDNNWTINDANTKVCLDETDILSFVLSEEFFEAVINTDGHTIHAVVKIDTDVSSLTPIITLSPGATIVPEIIDFTDTVTYTVTAEDQITTQDWTVIVSVQPENDFCTGAITVNVGDVVTGNTTFASNDSNVASDCGSNIVSNDPDGDGVSVGIWYHFVGNGETITLNTCSGDKYDFDDTSLSVYTGSCSEGLNCFAGNEDAEILDECGGEGYQARLKFNSATGVDYFILVDGYSDRKGEFDLAITSEPTLAPPANDNCEDAETVTVFAEGLGTSVNGDNSNATAFTRLLQCDEYAFINDVWYTFNSGLNTEVIIDIALTDTDEAGPLEAAGFINFELYDDCDGIGLEICDNDGITTITVTPNTDYWLQLWNSPDDEGTFTIQINDGPNTAADLSFRDATANEVEISRFAESSLEIDLVIADDDEEHAQLFSITAGNGEGIFAIDSESGSITIADAALLSSSASTSFTLTIQATDQGPGEVSSTIDLTVNIIDNAPPVVTTNINPIDENSPNGTEIGTIALSDPDGDNVIPISVEVDPVGSIEVDEATGVITVLNSELLDFEVNPIISGSITVQDDGPLGLTTTASYTLNLNDINEVPEVADSTFDISSFSGNGFLIGTIPFTDQDEGQTHTYAILEDGDNDGSIFAIDATSGELTVLDASILSANGETTYTFDVQVTDNGTEPLAGTGAVTINTFGNSAPVITSESFTENENTANNTEVGRLAATDADGDNITFSLEDESTVFTVEGNGRIRIADNTALDFETNPSFEILVGATDDGTGTLKTTKSITIFINDINEAPAITSAIFDISSNSLDGTVVGQVAAIDPEDDILTFEITSGDEEGAFNIDNTGVLRIANTEVLNPVTTPQYKLTITVSDGTFDVNTVVTVNVFLNNPPEINASVFEIAENNEIGAIIGTIEATDSDGIDAYQITGGNEEGIFEVDESNGDLSAIGLLNFEDVQSYELEITVSDEGLGNLTSTETITISVNDVNEYDPEINSVTGGIVAENAATGTLVATVLASDGDTFQSLSYQITGGNETGTFAIDANGQITTVLSPDFEVTESFNLTVAVSDDLDPVRTTAEEVVITITDVNESPIIDPIATQNGTIGSEIAFTVSASDPENGSLSFSFAENSVQAGMEISATTGEFTWTPTSNQFGTFQVTIEATDGEFTASRTVSIDVTNNATDITRFELAEQVSDAIIDIANHSVALAVGFGTDVSSLVPTFSLSEGATSSPASGEAVDFTNPAAILVTAEDGSTQQEWEVTLSFAPNTGTDIESFALNEQTEDAVIDVTAHAVSIEVAFGTDVSSLSPTLTLSNGANSDPASGEEVDFTSTVTYSVTAEDGTSTQDWLITVTEAPEPLSTETDILTFELAEQTSPATIDSEEQTVFIEVSFETDITSLEPSISLSEGAISSPASGEVVDFTDPVTYTVIAEDSTVQQDWIVTVTLQEEPLNDETDILTFELAEQISAAAIDTDEHTVAIEVSFDADITSLEPVLTLSEGATSSPVSGEVVDFTNPVTYTVIAEDSTVQQDWIVTVDLQDAPLNTETDILTFELAEQTGAAVINSTEHTVTIEVAFDIDIEALEPIFTLSEGATSNPTSGEIVDFTDPVSYTVIAEDSTVQQDWIVTVSVQEESLSTATDIVTFELTDQTGPAVINPVEHTVSIEVSSGSEIATLAPTFTLSEGATSSPISGEVVDFSDPVTFTVIAEDTTVQQDWIVTVIIQEEQLSTATDIETFEIAEQTGAAVINSVDHTVLVEVALDTDLTALAPTFDLSEGASSNPASDEIVDFSSPVIFTVTAEDGVTTQDWTVTVTEALNKETDFLSFTLTKQTGAAVINGIDHIISIEVDFSTNITALAPSFALSPGASSNPISGELVDFTNPVIYTVTAEDSTVTQDWTVNVTRASKPLSVEELLNIEIYPNPVSDVLSVDVQQEVIISVTDLKGHIVIPQMKGNHFNLDVRELSNGTFIIRIETADQVVTRKILKFN